MHLRAHALNVEWFCCRSVETFNKSVENMMSIKRFVEIKESAAAPRPLQIGCYLRPRCLQSVYLYASSPSRLDVAAQQPHARPGRPACAVALATARTA